MPKTFQRREVLRAGAVGAAASAGMIGRTVWTASPAAASRPKSTPTSQVGASPSPDAMAGTLACSRNAPPIGPVDTSRFDPHVYLQTFDAGTITHEGDKTIHTYDIAVVDAQIEIASGIKFPAWTYNGQVPGPTIRVPQGHVVRVHFTNNGSLPHTMHFHGFHPSAMDGADPSQWVFPGDSTVYEFEAEPFGVHLYHCHVSPFSMHINKGLYGMFIVDPSTPRPPARELVMMMNGFDTNDDEENEFYAVNTVAFYYLYKPIPLKVNQLNRIYLVNITEFDPVNSLHTHATFFQEYPTGTSLTASRYTDITTLGQAERSILEFTYKTPGQFMFHAHQTEFVDLGWNAMFEVT
jgi:manganese oxidase